MDLDLPHADSLAAALVARKDQLTADKAELETELDDKLPRRGTAEAHLVSAARGLAEHPNAETCSEFERALAEYSSAQTQLEACATDLASVNGARHVLSAVLRSPFFEDLGGAEGGAAPLSLLVEDAPKRMRKFAQAASFWGLGAAPSPDVVARAEVAAQERYRVRSRFGHERDTSSVVTDTFRMDWLGDDECVLPLFDALCARWRRTVAPSPRHAIVQLTFVKVENGGLVAKCPVCATKLGDYRVVVSKASFHLSCVAFAVASVEGAEQEQENVGMV